MSTAQLKRFLQTVLERLESICEKLDFLLDKRRNECTSHRVLLGVAERVMKLRAYIEISGSVDVLNLEVLAERWTKWQRGVKENQRYRKMKRPNPMYPPTQSYRDFNHPMWLQDVRQGHHIWRGQGVRRGSDSLHPPANWREQQQSSFPPSTRERWGTPVAYPHQLANSLSREDMNAGNLSLSMPWDHKRATDWSKTSSSMSRSDSGSKSEVSPQYWLTSSRTQHFRDVANGNGSSSSHSSQSAVPIQVAPQQWMASSNFHLRDFGNGNGGGSHSSHSIGDGSGSGRASGSNGSRSQGSTKLHICQYCLKQFNHRGNLVAHVRTHTGEKPYICKECGRGFAQKSNLKRHLRAAHNIFPRSTSRKVGPESMSGINMRGGKDRNKHSFPSASKGTRSGGNGNSYADQSRKSTESEGDSNGSNGGESNGDVASDSNGGDSTQVTMEEADSRGAL